jgi:hypothetical protein
MSVLSGRGWWLLIAVLCAAGLVWGCSSETAVTTGPTQVKCQVALAMTTASIGPEGGTGTLSVTTSPECPWEAATAVTWLSGLSPSSGQGDGTVSFQVAPNPLPTAREGDIVVNDHRLQVSQQAALCRFDLRPSSLSFDASGGEEAIAVAAPGGCTWTFASDADWVSFTSATTGSGAGTVRVRIAPNPGPQARAATITVGDQRIGLTQAAAGPTSCVYTVGLPANVSVPAAGETATVPVSTAGDCRWTATSGVAWITIVDGASGAGSGSVTFSVAANAGGVRVGTVTVAGQTSTVTQAAATVTPCTYAITPTSASVAAAGGAGTVAVSAGGGCGWTATSNAAWITVSSGTSGTGNGSVAYTVAANTGGARSGTLTVAGQTFTVTQDAAPAPCTYAIAPTSASVAAAGGTGTVAVSAGGSCSWTATSNAAWITVSSGTSGTGNGSVAYTVAANAGGARTGTLTVAGQTFTVTQGAAPAPCTYAVSPTSVDVGDNGGNRTITVSTGSSCAWTATSNANWISITDGASGTGVGLGCMGMSEFYGPRTRPSRSPRSTAPSSSASPSSTPPTCTARAPTRSWWAARSAAAATRSCCHQVRHRARRGRQLRRRQRRPEYVRSSCEASLRGSASTHIDLYYQHRVDPQCRSRTRWARWPSWCAPARCASSASRRRRPRRCGAPAVHPIAALQTEYSLWTATRRARCSPPAASSASASSPTARSAAASSPASFRSLDDLAPDDYRRYQPALPGRQLPEEPRARRAARRGDGGEKGCTPGQLALAWVLAQGDDIVPIPGDGGHPTRPLSGAARDRARRDGHGVSRGGRAGRAAP